MVLEGLPRSSAKRIVFAWSSTVFMVTPAREAATAARRGWSSREEQRGPLGSVARGIAERHEALRGLVDPLRRDGGGVVPPLPRLLSGALPSGWSFWPTGAGRGVCLSLSFCALAVSICAAVRVRR